MLVAHIYLAYLPSPFAPLRKFSRQGEREAAKRSPLGISDEAQVLDRLTSLGMFYLSFLSTSCHDPVEYIELVLSIELPEFAILSWQP